MTFTPPPLSSTTLELARLAGEGLLGVDALYRRESGDEDGLAVLNMDDTGILAARAFDSYADATEFWRDLRSETASTPEPDRALYYRQLCDSTLAFLEWRTTGLSFERQLSEFLHVPPGPASEAELEGLRVDMNQLLGELGYAGSLETRCAKWEAANRVPADEVPGVIAELMSEAWDRTAEIIDIPAPKSDGMRVAAVSGVAFNARCDYLNRTIDLNTDPVLTLQGLRHLAVHEGYPGHYVQFKLRETWAREGRAGADVLLSIVNSASSSVFEGLADTGLSMIGWDRDLDDRVQAMMNRYRAGIGTGAAWRLHAEGWETGSVTDWLAGQSLVGGDGWVENRMRFIQAPARAVLIWSYWWGERSVLPQWQRARETGRAAQFLPFLYAGLHSTQSVTRWGA
jgi:hypothetical protein